MLEDLGLRVIEEVPTRLLGGDDETWVQDFGVLGPDDRPLDLDAVGDARRRAASRPSAAATPSRTRSTGSCIAAGLDWRQVAILRAYRKYRQRIGSRFTESYQNDVLVGQPGAHREARALLRAALRPARASATRRPRRRCARRSSPTSTRSRRSTTTASCATSSG